jgi:hypothetical protein
MEWNDAFKYLHNKFDRQGPKRLYSLVTKINLSCTRADIRFFVVGTDNTIIDVTRYVAILAHHQLEDCGNYFAIRTHPTNQQDIVETVSHELYADRWEIKHERL